MDSPLLGGGQGVRVSGAWMLKPNGKGREGNISKAIP